MNQTSDSGGLSPAFWIAALAVVALAIGSVGTWIASDLPGTSQGGLDKDGKITIFLAIAAAVLLFVSTRDESLRVLDFMLIALGLIAGVIGVIDWLDVESALPDIPGAEEIASVGWGLILTTISGFALAAAGLAMRLTRD